MTAAEKNGRALPRTETARDPEVSYEYVEGWGMAVGGHSRVFRPTTNEGIRAAFEAARRDGKVIGPRGTGCSYGDASVNDAGYVLDITRKNKLLSFDPATGIADCEAGVTIEQLWKHILPFGYWPMVVSGTQFPTLAGAAAMNIHGKNNFKVGTIGDAILDFDIVLPNGEERFCSREVNSDLFHAAIGGFGMLGAFSRIRIRTKQVYSGNLHVKAIATRNLREMMDYFEEHKATADYLVGWIDCFAGGDMLCRGQIHEANYFAPGEDPHPEETLTLEHNTLPSSVAGVVPKSALWYPMSLVMNNPGVRFVNAVKYLMGRFEAMGEGHVWSHAQFAFLLDFVPNWKWSYGRAHPGRGGLIQYQPFLPPATAHDAYTEMMRLSQKRGIVPYLGVFKRHRPDPFWLTHSTGGWSYAMDFKVTPGNRAALWNHCRDLTRIVLDAGGRFYFAKDLVIGVDDARDMFPPERLEAFLALKREVDPDTLLQTNLWRRCFADAAS